MGNEREKIGESVSLSYISIIFSIVSGLLYTPWLIRELGSSDYALYTICVSLMAYFTIDFGIGASITRFIARYRAEGTEHKINGLLGIALKIYLIIDLCALAVLTIVYFLLDQIYVGLTVGELEKLKVVYLITGVMVTCCIPVMPLNGVFVAFGRVYDVKKFDLLQKLCSVGLICFSLIIGKGLYAVVLINAITTIGVNCLKIFSIHRTEKVIPAIKEKDRSITRELLTFSAWVALAMLADKFFFSFEPTLLGIFSNSTEISVFAVAASIEGYVLLFADGLNGVFLPRVTNMVVQKKSAEEFTSLMVRVGRIQMLVVSLFIMGIITQGQDFITIWFGREYSMSYYAAVIVLIPCFVHLTQSIATETLYATNNVKYRALAYVASSCINVIITALLAPKIGAIGAAVAISCGFIVGHEVILNVVYAKVLKLDLRTFFTACHMRALPALFAMFLSGVLIAYVWPATTRMQILLRCAVCGAIYLIITYALYLNKNERAYFIGMVKQALIRIKKK